MKNLGVSFSNTKKPRSPHYIVQLNLDCWMWRRYCWMPMLRLTWPSQEGFTPLMLAARTGQSYSAWKKKLRCQWEFHHFWIRDTSSKCCFSIVILVFGGVFWLLFHLGNILVTADARFFCEDATVFLTKQRTWKGLIFLNSWKSRKITIWSLLNSTISVSSQQRWRHGRTSWSWCGHGAAR